MGAIFSAAACMKTGSRSRACLGQMSRQRIQLMHVPAEKTVARYYRCLEQVKYALPYLNRAYFFDNSTAQLLYFAEYEQGKGFQLYSELIPEWFRRFILGE